MGKYMALPLILFLLPVWAKTRRIMTLNSTGDLPNFRVKVHVVEISSGLQVNAKGIWILAAVVVI